MLTWSVEKFELIYSAQVKREVIAQINDGRQRQIAALNSNGGFLQTDEGIAAVKNLIEEVNAHADDLIDYIIDPERREREEREFRENPLFAAGTRGLERLKWEFEGEARVRAELAAREA